MKGFLPAALAIVGTSVLYMYSGYDDATGLRASSFPSRQLRLNSSFTDPKNVMVKQEMDPAASGEIFDGEFGGRNRGSSRGRVSPPYL